MFSRSALSLATCLFLMSTGHAQSELPVADKGDVAQLRQNCRWLLTSLNELRAPLPDETRARLGRLLDSGGDAPESLVAIQKLLDPLCLVGVSINPESRVKASRGPAAADLEARLRRLFLVKVHNEAGVTQALHLDSPNFPSPNGQPDRDRWLRAEFYHGNPKGAPRKLSGHEVEYLILGCTPTEAGKREAKLSFDVGQGTQDLGFRAEVPILFKVK